MEKSDEIYVVEGDLGWSDLGSYSSVKEHIPSPDDDPVPDGCIADSTSNGNKAVGKDVRLFDCDGCIVHAEDAGTVIVKGLEGYIVAVKGGRCSSARSPMNKGSRSTQVRDKVTISI